MEGHQDVICHIQKPHLSNKMKNSQQCQASMNYYLSLKAINAAKNKCFTIDQNGARCVHLYVMINNRLSFIEEDSTAVK